MEFKKKEVCNVRKVRGLTQAQLAEKAGLSVTALCLIEKGRREPMVSTLCSIANALDVNIGCFFKE